MNPVAAQGLTRTLHELGTNNFLTLVLLLYTGMDTVRANRYELWALMLTIFCGLLSGCGKNTLEEIINLAGPEISTVTNNPDRFSARVLYVQINRDAQNRPHFVTYRYDMSRAGDFNPGESVQIPVAVLALEKLLELGVRIDDPSVRMRFDSARTSQSPMLFDHTSPTRMPSPWHFVHQVGVSGHYQAYNRLFEFLGHDEILERFERCNFASVRIIERYDPLQSETHDSRYVNPVSLFVHDTLVYQRDEIGATKKPVAVPVAGNQFSLEDQVRFLETLVFPESVPDSQRFCLDEDAYRLILRSMSAFPDKTEVSPGWPGGNRKFLLSGDDSVVWPEHVRAVNMSGFADGRMTDCAYIVDFMHQIEFIIAATVEVAPAGSDSVALATAAEEIGRPFFRQLGRAVHRFETERPRRYKPSLSHLSDIIQDPQH